MKDTTLQLQKPAESDPTSDPSHRSPTRAKGFGQKGTVKVESFQLAVPL